MPTTLSNDRDRCAHLHSLTEEYKREMQQKIDDAESAAREAVEIPLLVSRQTYRDLVDAYRFLRQINPLYKSIGKRLERLALEMRDQLDRKGVPALLPIYLASSMGIHPRRLLRLILFPFGIYF